MATYYWVGGGGTWNSTNRANWSATSGGPGGAGYPTILDDVIFDNNCGTGLIGPNSSYAFCRDFIVTATQSGLSFNGQPAGIAGNIILPAGGSVSLIGFNPVLIATSAKTITTNGKTVGAVDFNGINGIWTLQDALTASSITLRAGTFNTNNQSLTTGTFTSTVSNIRAINLGSSTVTVQTQGAAWTLGGTNLTFNAGTSTINLSGLINFVGGSLTYNNVNFAQTSMINGQIQTISGTNTFNNLTIASPNSSSINIVTIDANQTIRGTLTASGATNIQRIGIYSNVIGTQRTLTVNAWSASPANLDFRDIGITGAVGTLSGTSIGDCNNNLGITFTAAKTVYWNLAGTSNWSSTGWATSSGGSPNAANFPLAQDTCIFDNTGAMGTVIFNVSWNIGTINASARTSGGFSQGASSTINIYGDVVFGSGMSSTTNSTGVWNFAKQGTQTINTNGVNLNSIISVNSSTGTLRLLGNLTHNFSQTTTLTSGTFDLNNFTYTTNGIFAIAANALARRIEFGTGAITMVGNVDAWNAPTLTNFTLTGTPTVNFPNGASVLSTRQIQHGDTAGGTETNAISVNVVGGTGSFIVRCSGHFRNINLTGFSANFGNDTRFIYGNLTISTGTTITAGGSATTFAGTSVVQDLTSNGKTLDFPITINGASNTLRLLDAFTQGTGRAFTINSGTTFDANNFSASVGNLTFTATPNITNLVSGTLTAETVTHTSGTLTMSAALKINVTGTYTFTAGTLDFGNQSVSFGSFNSSNFNARTINLGSSTLTITGTSQCWNTISASGLTFNAGTSTISFTNASTKQMSTEGLTFYNVNQGGAGALTIAGSSSASVFNSISNSVAPTTILFPNSFITSVRNLNLNGTAGNLVTIGGSTAASNFSLDYIGSTVSTMNFVSISYAQIQRAGAVFATNSTNGGNNLNLTFGAADTTPRYWVGGTGTWTNTANTNWSTSSGGSTGASAPTIETNVIFDANSNVGANTFTVSLSGTSTTQLVCNDLTISGLDGTLTWTGTGTLNISGSALFPATNFTRTFTGSYVFRSTTTGKTITCNGQTITSSTVTFDGVGGGWTLTDAFVIGSSITLTNGSFNTGGFTLTTTAIFSTNSNIRSINFGASTVNLTSNTPIIFGNITNLTFNAGTSTIVANSGNNTQTNYGGLTYYNYVQTSPAGTAYQITGQNTFNNFTVNLSSNDGHLNFIFTANTTINGTLSFTGQIVTRRIFLSSNTIGTQRRLNINAISGVSDIDFRDIAITGAVGTLSGTRLGDCLGNSGITFTAKNVYWNLAGSSNWNQTGWALTPTGTPDANNFPLAQDTAIFTNSGGSGTLSGPTSAYNMPSIDMSARTTAFTWQFTTNLFYHGNLLFGTGVTITGVSGYSLVGRGSHNILTSGKTFPGNMLVNCVSGTYTLNDALTSTNRLDLQSGTLNTNNQTVTFTAFEGNYTAARALILGTSTLNLTTTGTIFSPGTIASFTFSGESSTLNLTDSSASLRTISGGGLRFGTLNIGGALGTSTLSLEGNGTSFNNITSTKTVAHTISIPNSTTINFNNFNVSGSFGRLVTLTGVASNASLYNYTGLGVVSIDYINVTPFCGFRPLPNSSGTTPFVWYFGENSINQTGSGTTSGSAFISGNKRAYLLNSTGSFAWTVPKDWNNNDNIIHMIGAGGGGTGAFIFGSNRAGGAGGGGGGYTLLSNLTLQPNSLLPITVAALQGSGNTKGNDTIINSTYFAGGGQAGNVDVNVPISVGGQGGIGGKFNGGNGGSGSFAIAASTAHGAGGGGGSAGPFGQGGNGGNGFSGLSNSDAASGGGGGNGGGTNGGNATLATPGQGGNGYANILGSPGGSFSTGSGTGTGGTRGGGGGGSRVSSSLGGSGSAGLDIHNTIGSGGATGGTQNNFDFGTGGSGGAMQTGGGGSIPSAGGPGVIFIVYTPLPYNARLFSNGNFLLRYNMQLDEITKRTFGYDQNTVYSSQFDEVTNYSAPYDNNSIRLTGGQYLSTSNTASFGFGTGDFTIELWYYSTSTSPSFQPLIDFRTLLGDIKINLWSAYVGSIVVYVGSGVLAIDGGPAGNINTWYHIALTRSGTNLKLFLNGNQIGTTYTSTQNLGSTSDLVIGTAGDARGNASYSFNGFVTGIRIIKGAALYTSNFTRPIRPLGPDNNTVLCLNVANNAPFIDSSYLGNSIRVNGSATANAFSPFASYSISPTAMQTNSTGNTFITGSFDEVTGIY